MVHIPVKLFTAASSHDVRFNRWDAANQCKPRQVQLDGTGKEMAITDMSRVFEVAKGTYVEITDEDMEAIAPESSRHMQVIEFVPLESVDPIRIEKTYYMGHDERGAHPYALFMEALAQEGKAAIVRVVFSTKEQLAMIWVDAGSLCLSTLYYEDEIRRENAAGGKYGELLEPVDPAELEVARMLICAMAVESYDANKHVDVHHGEILAMIARKAAGETIETKTAPVPSAPVSNILDVLRASIENRKVAA